MSCYCGKTRKRPNFGIHFLDVFDEINSRVTTVPYSLEEKKCVFPSTVSGPAGCFCLFVCLWPLHIIGLRGNDSLFGAYSMHIKMHSVHHTLSHAFPISAELRAERNTDSFTGSARWGVLKLLCRRLGAV